MEIGNVTIWDERKGFSELKTAFYDDFKTYTNITFFSELGRKPVQPRPSDVNNLYGRPHNYRIDSADGVVR